ncbi:bifunctional transaldolase/phosoglucose isomerase (plasmid) [Sphingobium sp. SJ10-10]|uniref:bifunctional transaldolase/phosoglucose isomerase n=1 Tax=unclassified Sphingobium TaxID=2611147 RepID=UPI00077009ED|nr:bifunctional transaldolase/phosoglucose isomerase [Sphingobium sp. TKS]AMK26488.1 bifunctional transaldolase/phosoglucose isomerase [Sphingobium sp. TKS]
MTNRLRSLEAEGQAVWLDFLDRRLLAGGGLTRLIEEDGVTGLTSNPSIFEKAIGHGRDYDEEIAAVLDDGGATISQIYEHLAITDIQAAADALRPVYDRLNGADGFASIEVSPFLAHSTQGTIDEARRLWAAIDRPNLMVKVPGTREGVPAIRALTAAGINVNITLLFARDMYAAVAEAFIAGLEDRVARGDDITGISSVASFFVSRIDTRIDATIDARRKAGDAEANALAALRGKVAIANAQLAYQYYLELMASTRWQGLAKKGARSQRLLWASTGTKDPSFSDVLYVERLIGRDTINTMPPNTIAAFLDHGVTSQSLTTDIDDARVILAEADRLGLDLAGVTAALVVDGIDKFSDAADALFEAIARARSEMLDGTINRLEASLPEPLRGLVDTTLERAGAEHWSRRLWSEDATLWTEADENRWLGWLRAGRGEAVDRDALATFAAETRRYDDIVLLGMGGSSLGAEVISRVLGRAPGHPKLHVLDTTDPGQIQTVAAAIDPAKTLFIVSSKSGTTMEPDLLRGFFREQVERAVGEGEAGPHFVAITDPGSALEKRARAARFEHIFAGDPQIGGRYSVLSPFGLVPAAAIGVDVPALLSASCVMADSCGGDVPPAVNSGIRLGVIIGEAAKAGRNKLTILASARMTPFGAWLEQLLAESTGKHGTGVIPVDLEPIGTPDAYGQDRLFVHLRLIGDEDAALDGRVAALEAAGQPVVRIGITERLQIGQEFFRWEIATAVVGAVLGINPFDQPDVEAAKVKARALVDSYERTGSVAPQTPIVRAGTLSFFANRPAEDAVTLLKAHFHALGSGGYAAFLAYIERSDSHELALSQMRVMVRDALRVATVAGFGPRFLHSTGQAYKGGPAGGVFLILTRDADPDLAIPDHRASFGTVQLAQALGDIEVLAERGRRWLRVHIHGAEAEGLAELGRLIAAALA